MATINLTIRGVAVGEAFETTPEAYAKAWRARKPGTRDKASYFGVYASVYEQTDTDEEIEISALVDLNPNGASIDDVRCRLHPNGAEVELADETIEALRDRLVDAAERAVS